MAPNGITANVVCPSSVEHADDRTTTPPTGCVRPDLEEADARGRAARVPAVNLIPVPYAETDDVSDAVLFFASDAASYITGATLSPSAGLSASNV